MKGLNLGSGFRGMRKLPSPDGKKGIYRFGFEQHHSLQSLYENLEVAFRGLPHLFDDGFGADLKEVIKCRIFLFRVPLGGH